MPCSLGRQGDRWGRAYPAGHETECDRAYRAPSHNGRRLLPAFHRQSIGCGPFRYRSGRLRQVWAATSLAGGVASRPAPLFPHGSHGLRGAGMADTGGIERRRGVTYELRGCGLVVRRTIRNGDGRGPAERTAPAEPAQVATPCSDDAGPPDTEGEKRCRIPRLPHQPRYGSRSSVLGPGSSYRQQSSPITARLCLCHALDLNALENVYQGLARRRMWARRHKWQGSPSPVGGTPSASALGPQGE
jgi:hypothetical protein